MLRQLNHTLLRYRTLYTDRISALPIVILMPHSACNCRCVMCDIWKGNRNLKQLTEADVSGLLDDLKQLQTKLVVMSGGEALLNENFFSLCRMLKQQGIRVTLLSTGLLLEKHAAEIVQWVDNLIISLDGDEEVHDQVRNVKGCYRLMMRGVEKIREINPGFRITARTVIHRLNFQVWPAIISAARSLGVQQISFLPADVSSTAFNREVQWDQPRQEEVMLSVADLPVLQSIVEEIISSEKEAIDSRFIAEPAEKLRNIYRYYAALLQLGEFPVNKCNAPWVSAVIEADGNVRPCFFHKISGNIREQSFREILNGNPALDFRRNLDMAKDETCRKCVCYLNLHATADPGAL
ncbi:MAG TPA: radical SAM protein [Chitinophagaceae bacterium]